MEVFSARLLHILVITIIKTMVMFNNSPKGSKDWGSNWLRKKKFQFSLRVPVASGTVWKMMLQAFYPVSQRLAEDFRKSICNALCETEVRIQLRYRLLAVLLVLLK